MGADLMSNKGFTLVELLIGLAVLGVLMALGVPLVQNALTNVRLKAAATSFSSGIQFARAQAISGNETVRFVQQPAGTLGWQVVLPANPTRNLVSNTALPRNDDEVIQTKPASEAAGDRVTVGFVGTAFTRIDFNGLGRPTFVGGGPAGEYRITSPADGTCADVGGPVRCLNIVISAAGQVRLCDRAAAAGDTRAC